MSNAVEEASLAREERLMRERDEARAEVERLERAVQAVRGIHRKHVSAPICEECLQPTPCSTTVVIDAVLGGERHE